MVTRGVAPRFSHCNLQVRFSICKLVATEFFFFFEGQHGHSSKSVNMVIGNTEKGTSGYGKFLPTIFSVFHSTEWLVATG